MSINDNQLENQPLANPWVIFFVTALGVAMASIDGGIVNVALPMLHNQFHTTVSIIQWVVSSYLLIICVTLPLFGYLSDLFTRRRMYLLGLFIFTVSSFLCGISFSFTSLLIFRFLQGIGAAMVLANNSAIIMMAFPLEKRGRALGVNSMLVAVGSIAGPGLGGFLLGLGNWRPIFFINIPLGILGCILGRKILPKDKVSETRAFDLMGAIYFAVMMTAFILMLNYSFVWGWTSWKIRLFFAVTILSGALFFFRERVAKQPMIDFDLFKIKAYFSGNIVSLFMFIALSSNMILLPFYLYEQQALSPNLMGVFMLIAPVFIVFIAPISGFMAERMNASLLTSVGLGAMFLGLLSQSFLTAHSSLSIVVVDQALIGIGCGLFSSPNNYSMLSSVPSEKIGISNSINSLVRNVGKIAGTVLATSIFTAIRSAVASSSTSVDKLSNGFTLGFRFALLTAALMVFIGMIMSIKRYKFLS